MDQPTRPTSIHFANRLIRMMVDHSLGEDMIILPTDYLVLRVLFRNAKGSWEKVALGDIVHTRLLATIVGAWAKMPQRKRHTEVAV